MVKAFDTAMKGIDVFTAIWIPNDKNFETIVQYAMPFLNDVNELKKRILAYDRYLNDTKLGVEDREKLRVYADPVPLFLASYDIQNGRAARNVIRKWWKDYMSVYLKNPVKLYGILARKPEVKAILNTNEGFEYLKFVCQQSYGFFYKYLTDFPRRHNPPCYGKVKYGKVSAGSYHVWSYYCTKCGTVWNEENMYANTYKVQYKKKPKQK